MGSSEAKKTGETDNHHFAVAASRDTPYFTEAERAAFGESSSHISTPVGTALTAVPMLNFENFTQENLRD